MQAVDSLVSVIRPICPLAHRKSVTPRFSIYQPSHLPQTANFRGSHLSSFVWIPDKPLLRPNSSQTCIYQKPESSQTAVIATHRVLPNPMSLAGLGSRRLWDFAFLATITGDSQLLKDPLPAVHHNVLGLTALSY